MAVAATMPTDMIDAALSASTSRSKRPKSFGLALDVMLAATNPAKALSTAMVTNRPIDDDRSAPLKMLPSVAF